MSWLASQWVQGARGSVRELLVVGQKKVAWGNVSWGWRGG